MAIKDSEILVVGSNGQLGKCFQQLKGDKYHFASSSEVDITNIHSIWDYVEAHGIKMIINCAAYTNVDKAEEEHDKAHLVNAIGVENLASVMRDVNGVLIHISTDYVFGGDCHNIPYTEEDLAHPECVYGVSKLCGEVLIRTVGCKALIFRTSWLYSEFGNNFFTKMLKLTSEKNELKVVIDQIGTPTYAMDLAYYICNIIDNNLYEGNEGMYHYSNEGVCSWFDFAREINDISGHQCQIKPCLSDELPLKVKRPTYSVLSKEKAKNTFKMDVPYWRDGLKRCYELYLRKKEELG